MSRFVWPAVSVALVAAIAAGLNHWVSLGYWASFLIVGGAILVNGVVATVEDDLPGGFNNPDGTDTPRYISYFSWMGRGLMLVVIGFCIFSLALWALS